MLEQSLEYPVEAKNMRDKGGIEKCITKAKGDMVEKVWGKGGTRLVLSLKGERNLPPEFVAKRKKQKAIKNILSIVSTIPMTIEDIQYGEASFLWRPQTLDTCCILTAICCYTKILTIIGLRREFSI